MNLRVVEHALTLLNENVFYDQSQSSEFSSHVDAK